MKWENYCETHLRLIGTVLSDALLAIRSYDKTRMYRSCNSLIWAVKDLRETNCYCGGVPIKLVIELFGKTFLWCTFYADFIAENPIRHKVQLLGCQLRKHVKKNRQRLDRIIETQGYDLYELINCYDYFDCQYISNNVIYNFMVFL